MNSQVHSTVKRTAQLIWEEVQLHRNLTLRSQVHDLLDQLQSYAASPAHAELLDGLDNALRSEMDDGLIVARAHLSALRGVMEDDDLTAM